MLNKRMIISMLIISFLLIIASIVILERAVANTGVASLGDLRCDDLTGCQSSAGCGGPGSPDGCVILCENGAVVECPTKTI